MSLPTIAILKYECVLPDSKQKIVYRCFNVAEEKILLLAATNKEDNFIEVYKQIENVLEKCILSNVDISKMSTIDFEYMFLKVKSASRGSIEELKYMCKIKDSNNKECGSELNFVVDFDNIKISNEFPNPVIKLEDNLIVKMKVPNINEIMNMSKSDLDDLELLAVSLEYVTYNNETSTDFTLQEALEFLQKLSADQIEPIAKYFEAMPKLQYTEKIKCNKCGHEHEIVLQGLESFFL